jgi:hypothetical protein
MLGAYAFFFNAYSPDLRAGEDIGPVAANRSAWNRQVRVVARARTAARLLGLVPLVVFAVFAPEVWERIEAVAAHPTLDRYSTLDVAFMVLACSWLAIAILVTRRAMALSTVLARLHEGAPPA